MIDHEYLRKWAIVITVASAVTAVGMKYAVMDHQLKQIEKRFDKKQEYIDSLEVQVSNIRAENKVLAYQVKKLGESFNRSYSYKSDKHLDE